MSLSSHYNSDSKTIRVLFTSYKVTVHDTTFIAKGKGLLEVHTLEGEILNVPKPKRLEVTLDAVYFHSEVANCFIEATHPNFVELVFPTIVKAIEEELLTHYKSRLQEHTCYFY